MLLSYEELLVLDRCVRYALGQGVLDADTEKDARKVLRYITQYLERRAEQVIADVRGENAGDGQ